MDYYDRSQLPVIELPENAPAIGWDMLRQAIISHPFNIVLTETAGKLSGIISHGDMLRARAAGKSAVPVNRNYTALSRREYMRAREILHGQENIRELPITDEEGRLCGVCTSSDDLLYLEYCSPWKGSRYAKAAASALGPVIFVRPPEGDRRRHALMQSWMKHLGAFGVQCLEAGFSSLPALLEKETAHFLVPDREMLQGAHILAKVLNPGHIAPEQVLTYRELEAKMGEHAYDSLLQAIAASGISIYTLYYTLHENTEGRKRLAEGFRQWSRLPEAKDTFLRVPRSQAPAFYGDSYSPAYAETVGVHYYEVEKSRVYCRLKDCSEPYFHIAEGVRLTTDQPEQAERTIYFFGPCITLGTYVEDGHTIESFLQRTLNREGISARVVNCSCYSESPYQAMIHLTTTTMQPGDVVVLYLENRPYSGIPSVDLMEVLDENQVPCDWLLESPMHCNARVNEIYARELFRRMKADGIFQKTPVPSGKDHKTMLSRDLAVKSLYLDLYFNDYTPPAGKRVGMINMHANPFTRGHRYLIETAGRQVDLLFVLVVQDEIGSFSFADRFAMAVDGTRDLPNVRVLPEGPFQASRNVFPEYFMKVEPAAIEKSVELLAEIYCQSMAKPLGVSCRFFGEEKHNPTMERFNELMEKYLTRYGIEFVLIPRAETKGAVISASAARKAALEGDIDTLLANVPPSTARYMLGYMPEQTNTQEGT